MLGASAGAAALAAAGHRDTGTDVGHPLALRSLQAMIYLSDVSPGTHCFSISPESVADLREPRATGEQLEHSPGLDLHGAAGSVFLFNSSALHAVGGCIIGRQGSALH